MRYKVFGYFLLSDQPKQQLPLMVLQVDWAPWGGVRGNPRAIRMAAVRRCWSHLQTKH